MKKITILLSVIGILFAVLPLNVSAAELKEKSRRDTQFYGKVTVMETDGWDDKQDGGKFITQEYYVTKTQGGYVYIRLLETSNVKITSILPGSNFTKVKEIRVDGGVDVVLKAKSTISSRTQLITVLADIVDPSQTNCVLNYSPLGVSCLHIDDLYLDKNGNEVSEAEYNEVCNGVTTPGDVPSDNPSTGNPIPYIAVGGGLLAIAGVYFFSRKSNKFYKI